ncbi:MAG: hypothetical protein ABUT20_00290 [Bacteroidota bacterium]
MNTVTLPSQRMAEIEKGTAAMVLSSDFGFPRKPVSLTEYLVTVIDATFEETVNLFKVYNEWYEPPVAFTGNQNREIVEEVKKYIDENGL